MISPLPDHLDFRVRTKEGEVLEFPFDRNKEETDQQFLSRCMKDIEKFLEDAGHGSVSTISTNKIEPMSWQSGDTLSSFLRRYYNQVLGIK